ncbi:oxygenase MpaB family protein [Amycolatopsis sp. NPDC004079]|uniref:oxygenase MpaB family protein n=1 Tax=Amycolatopsis sp. NPDC004079 TaxID=3154549 RepID=UPI0033B89385
MCTAGRKARKSRPRDCENCTEPFTGTADGRRYSALDPGAYAWVHATLAPFDAQRFFGRPMSTSDLDEYYAQLCGIGRILGVRERYLPPTWPEFEQYYREMIAGFGPDETISTLFETIDTVGKPFARMSDHRWSKLQKGALDQTDVPDPHAGRSPSPRPRQRSPHPLRGTALVQSIRPH